MNKWWLWLKYLRVMLLLQRFKCKNIIYLVCSSSSMRGIGRWSVACPCSMVCPPPAPAMGGPRLFTPRPPRTRALSSVFMTRLHNAHQLIAGNKNLIFNGNIWNITHQHEVDNEFHCFVGQWNCPVGGNFVGTVDRGLELSTQLRDIILPAEGLCKKPSVGTVNFREVSLTALQGTTLHDQYLSKQQNHVECWILVYLSIRNVSLKLSLRAGDCSGHHISAAVSAINLSTAIYSGSAGPSRDSRAHQFLHWSYGFAKFKSPWRRSLLEPSPCWKRLLPLSQLRIY